MRFIRECLPIDGLKAFLLVFKIFKWGSSLPFCGKLYYIQMHVLKGLSTWQFTVQAKAVHVPVLAMTAKNSLNHFSEKVYKARDVCHPSTSAFAQFSPLHSHSSVHPSTASMKPTTILSVLPLLGLAAALPQNHIRGTDDEAAIMAPDISREKAMAMAEMLESVDEEESFAEELAIDEYGLLEDCKPVTVIFAKGTGEWGNMGNGHSPGPAVRSFPQPIPSLGLTTMHELTSFDVPVGGCHQKCSGNGERLGPGH